MGRFVNPDAPICFAFSYGVAVVGIGFAMDPQAVLFSCGVQVFFVLPSLAYCLLRDPAASKGHKYCIYRFLRSMACYDNYHNESILWSKVGHIAQGFVFWYYVFLYPAGLYFASTQIDGSFFFLIISPASLYVIGSIALCVHDFAKVGAEHHAKNDPEVSSFSGRV
jgi:hypothetical protein